MFYVNYDSDGNIVSYTGAPDAQANDCPLGCQTLVFTDNIPGFINSNGGLMMKVDTVNKLLVFLNPVTIPKPVGG